MLWPAGSAVIAEEAGEEVEEEDVTHEKVSMAGSDDVTRVCRASPPTAVGCLNLAGVTAALAALSSLEGTPAASLDVYVVAKRLPLAVILVAGTLLTDLGWLLVAGNESAATGRWTLAGAAASAALLTCFLAGTLPLLVCLLLAPTCAGCVLAGKTGCHCSSSSSDGSAVDDFV